jgi:hypothetical protein
MVIGSDNVISTATEIIVSQLWGAVQSTPLRIPVMWWTALACGI